MEVRVKLFGPVAAHANANEITLDVDHPITCGSVLTSLRRTHPDLAPAGARLAINHAFVADTHEVQPSDELALIALVSGG